MGRRVSAVQPTDENHSNPTPDPGLDYYRLSTIGANSLNY